jgi:hypothetical protein
MNDIALIGALLLPAAILVSLRINAAVVFLSLCLGQVLVQFVAKDADSLIAFIAPNATSVSGSTLLLIMLFLPVVLTSLIMLHTVKGRLKVTFNALPALGVGALAVLLAVPLLTPGLQYAIKDLSFWQQLYDAQAMIIGISAFFSLLVLWLHRPKHSGGGEEKAAHHH